MYEEGPPFCLLTPYISLLAASGKLPRLSWVHCCLQLTYDSEDIYFAHYLHSIDASLEGL